MAETGLFDEIRRRLHYSFTNVFSHPQCSHCSWSWRLFNDVRRRSYRVLMKVWFLKNGIMAVLF